MARLEERLGTRLLQRTTRRVALTEAGRALEMRASRMIEEAGAGAEVAALATAPLGTLRVNGPVVFGETFLAPALPELLARHPGLRVELVLDPGWESRSCRSSWSQASSAPVRSSSCSRRTRSPGAPAIHALHARARPTPPKVKVFLDHLSARLRPAGVK